MKTIINLNIWKATVNAVGDIEVTLNGHNKKFEGKLSASELEQFCYRIQQSSEGVISFDPVPQDLVGQHESDLTTLEMQSTALETLRDELKAKNKELEALAEEFSSFKKEHEEVDGTLANFRDQIKHLTLDLHEARGEIEKLIAVHNERSTIKEETIAS